jgi:very-short-patch-repair endonuclease
MAAVLACRGATASHSSAAALWQLMPAEAKGGPVHVTVRPEHRCGRRPGIRAHRSELAADEVARIDGIPVTTPMRTLIDLGATLGTRELERALAQVERLGLARSAELQRLLDRHASRPGTRHLRELLNRATPPAFTRSEAEDRLLTLIRRSGLPEPEMNVLLHGVEIDCLWRRARLAVEVDGYAFHHSPQAFLRDRQRDATLAAAGIQVLRLTWHQIESESEKTIAQLAQALARTRQ